MQKFLIGMAAAFVAAAALGVTLDELNVARDPENLDGATYGEALYNLNLRLGPSAEFDSIAVIPGGSEIPIIGWVSGADGESLWVRTWYGEKKGWACAFAKKERLIERKGKALFTLKVVKEGLIFRTHEADGVWSDECKIFRLHRGTELEFISVDYLDIFERDFCDCDIFVRYENLYGTINAYGDGLKHETIRDEVVVKQAPWAISYPPEFIELSLEYDFGIGLFECVGPEEYHYYYSGQGKGYEKLYGPEPCTIIDGVFVEGGWVLVKIWGGFGWVYLGTAEEPNIQTYYDYENREAIWHYPQSIIEEADGGIRIGVKITQWPTRRKIYLEMTGPYFSVELLDNTEVDKIIVYQPPVSDAPLYSGKPPEFIKSSWHETGFYSYGVTLPEAFAPDEPFRVVGNFSFKKTHKFEMEFLCNADK